ncbi:Uncharacterized conserved protein [Chloracidobacterium thermophilum B]|uniref:Uncharacterized conserved protein n=2 Tax=Chloracidobacterium thermophilum TaxID=458033 RepID=G2LH39_CHLTF|nr:Uncharacterized conserved protein [Chloracidobacterium thermophilum B]
MAQRKTGWHIWPAGLALGFLWAMTMPNLPVTQVAAQERSTSVGGGKAGGGETTSSPGSGRGRSSSKGARPPAVPCPSGPLAPTVALPAEQLSTVTFESPRLDDKGNTVETVKGETQRFVENLGNQVTLELVAVPGGCFTMGNTVSDETESYDNERPLMRARVFGFYMGRTEVTQAQWREVASWPKVERDLPPSPSKYTGDDLPVDSITWDEAVEFCRRLTKRTGRPYRLPTEAEWEYACRAGATGLFAYGAVLLPTLENYDGSLPYRDEPAAPPRKKPTPAGSLGVNPFGLADMHGNVREWCLDTYTSRLTGIQAQGAPVRNIHQEEWAQHRTIRGGSWASLPDGCRCSIREGLHREELLTTLGFRVVLSDRYGEGQPIELDNEEPGRTSGSLRLNERTSAPAFSHRPEHPHP